MQTPLAPARRVPAGLRLVVAAYPVCCLVLGVVCATGTARLPGAQVLALLPAIVYAVLFIIAIVGTLRLSRAIAAAGIGLSCVPFMVGVDVLLGAVGILSAIGSCVAVWYSRAVREHNAWRALISAALARGHDLFAVDFAKPNGAKTTVNGMWLLGPKAGQRANIGVWGRAAPGLTLALDAQRVPHASLPTGWSRSYAHFAERSVSP